jgi:multidrug efflux pump subunit AcrA (membrane-fusion protein)
MTDMTNHDTTYQMPLPNERARGTMVAGFGVIAVFFFGMGGWAAYAPLNGAVVAPAVIKVEGNRKTIQHLDGGIVKKLLVNEGDRVAIGQSLIILDDTQARAAVDMLSQQSYTLQAQEARLLAERDGNIAIAFPDELVAQHDDPAVSKILQTETKQFEIRRTGLEGQDDHRRRAKRPEFPPQQRPDAAPARPRTRTHRVGAPRAIRGTNRGDRKATSSHR